MSGQIRFGAQLWLEEYGYSELKSVWRRIEELGFDSAWLYDHFYPMSNETSWSILEPWTVLPLLAEETSTLRLGILVTCNSYHHPPILAKIAATADIVSNGRLEFAIGAGWFKREYDAYGIPFPDARTRIEQLDEAVEIIKRIWMEEKVSFEGKHYRVRDLISYPKPIQKPHPPIWIGGSGSLLLKVTAKHADYSNFVSCTPEEYGKKLEILRKRCGEVGRDFDEIVKTWHGFMFIVKDEEELRRKAQRFKEESNIDFLKEMSLNHFLETTISGTPEQCIEKMRKLVDMGVTYFIPYFPYSRDLESQETFMEEIAPEVRKYEP